MSSDPYATHMRKNHLLKKRQQPSAVCTCVVHSISSFWCFIFNALLFLLMHATVARVRRCWERERFRLALAKHVVAYFGCSVLARFRAVHARKLRLTVIGEMGNVDLSRNRFCSLSSSFCFLKFSTRAKIINKLFVCCFSKPLLC